MASDVPRRRGIQWRDPEDVGTRIGQVLACVIRGVIWVLALRVPYAAALTYLMAAVLTATLLHLFTPGMPWGAWFLLSMAWMLFIDSLRWVYRKAWARLRPKA